MSINLDIKKLSQMIISKRGSINLRDAANEIGGISASTLSRIEQGNLPDIDTFFRLCNWLNVPTDFFSKNNPVSDQPKQHDIVAHLRADRTLSKDTAEALIKMINLAYDSRNRTSLRVKK